MNKKINPNKGVPFIHNKQELQEYLNPIYIINDYWVSKEEYEGFQNRMRNIVRAAVKHKEQREYEVKFKFYKDDEKIHTMQLRRFLINVYAWYGFYEIYGNEGVVDDTFIIYPENIPDINEWLYYKVAQVLESFDVVQDSINQVLADTTHMLNSISLDFSIIMGLHFDETDFIALFNEPSIREMIEYSFTGLQPSEIEAKMDEMEIKLVEYLKADPKNPIGIILRNKSGIKTKQLRELLLAVGLRPGIMGNETVPLPIQNAYAIGGLDRPSYMYIDGLGARKPLLANNKDMGPVGYFGKKVNIATRTLEVSTEVLNCGTRYYVPYEIKSKRHLKLLVGKFFFDEEIGDIRPIAYSDKHLIGKKINVRSVTTCACGNNKTCATCVGTSINLNWDIPAGFGTFLTEEWAKVVEQDTLSTKHLLTTDSEEVKFSKEFYKFFRLDGEEITLLSGVAGSKDLSIRIDPEDIVRVEEFDPDSTYNTFISTGCFYIINTKTKKEIKVMTNDDRKVYIRTETSKMMSSEGIISLKDIDENQPLFEITIENSELTKPFYDLMRILDTEKRDPEQKTIEGISQACLDIFVRAGLTVPIVSIEFTLNRICRRPDDVRKRPNFRRRKEPYHFYSVSKVLENNGSALIGLIFEQLRRQITKMDFIDRTDTSYIDPMFNEWVSMEPFLRHRESIQRDRESN